MLSLTMMSELTPVISEKDSAVRNGLLVVFPVLVFQNPYLGVSTIKLNSSLNFLLISFFQDFTNNLSSGDRDWYLFVSILYPKCRMNSKIRIQQCSVDSPKVIACLLQTFL